MIDIILLVLILVVLVYLNFNVEPFNNFDKISNRMAFSSKENSLNEKSFRASYA